MSHLSDALGLDRQGQTQRIQRQPVLFDGFRKGGIQTPGGVQTAGLIRVDLVPLWLAGINTGRIKEEERREKLERYQREAAKVLWEAFQEGRLTTDVEFDELLRELNDENKRKLPEDAPLGFIKRSLRPLVEENGEVSKRAWECALLLAIRDEIRVGNVYVKDSKRFG